MAFGHGLSVKSTTEEVKALRAVYGVSQDDLKEVMIVGKAIDGKVEEIVDEFYIWLRERDEWDQYFSDPQRVIALKKVQVTYWEQFFTGKLDVDYVDYRRFIGETHARIGLGLPAYFAALTNFLDKFSPYITSVEQFAAVNRLLHLDAALTVESFNRLSNKTISDQNKALMEMSTPVT